MKKLFVVLLVFAASVTASSCSEEEVLPVPAFGSDGSCIVRQGDETYSCNIRLPANELQSVMFNSPENVKGMTFSKNNGKFSVSFGSLICRNSEGFLEADSFPVKLSAAAEEAVSVPESFEAEKKENGYVFTGKKGVLLTDSSGIIKEITVK